MAGYVSALARFAADVASGAIPLPDDVRVRARQIVLDSCGAMIAAQRLPEIEALSAALGRQEGSLASLIVLGSAGVSLELDEGCAASRGHPGIHVVPAALEAAARRGSSGEATLRAIVAGYEVAARLGAATMFRHGVHPHGTWGGTGGAIAVGLLEGLGPDALAQAIRIAASLSVATHYEAVHEGVTARNLWAGLANAVSLLAVRAAASGFTGSDSAPAHVFGGTLGLGFDARLAEAGLGSDWYMLRNYFKLYACCRHAHASVDAFRAALGDQPIPADAIEAIAVATYGRAADAVGASYRPATPLAAKFSLPYMLSVYHGTGSLGPEMFEPPYLGDDRFHALSDRVSVAEDPAYTAMLPGVRPARVTLRLADGSERIAEALGSRGDPHDPLNGAEVEAKFRRVAGDRLGDRTDAVVDEILHIDARPDMRAIYGVLDTHLP